VNPPNKVLVLQDHSPGSDAGQQRKSKDGEKTIVVPSDATGGNLIPGDKADLLPRAKNIHPAVGVTADGTWEATVALVGRDGITPHR
jgi:hypothetical protein